MFADGSSTSRDVAEETAPGVDIGDPVTATDEDGDVLTYTLSGTDAGAFKIDSTTGQLRTNAELDYETKSSYTLTITASDGTAEATITVTINVVDAIENRAPVFTEGSSTTRSVAENTNLGADIGSAVSATDPDGDTLIYTLDGIDANWFDIDNINGQLLTSGVLDYDTKSSYSVIVTASDGELANSITVTIDVTDANDVPLFTTGSTSITFTVPENTAANVNIGSPITATDDDGDTLSYVVAGVDAIAFKIDNTGQLQTTGYVLDYETKNSFSFVVIVSDGSITNTITVTINLTDVEPEIIEPVIEPISISDIQSGWNAASIDGGTPDDFFSSVLPEELGEFGGVELYLFTFETDGTWNVNIVFGMTVEGNSLRFDIQLAGDYSFGEGNILTINRSSTSLSLTPFSPELEEFRAEFERQFAETQMVEGTYSVTLEDNELILFEPEADITVVLQRASGNGALAPNGTPSRLAALPKSSTLMPNYPNPFNPETWIPYQLSESAKVTLTIYDVKGEIVRQFALGHKAAGIYRSRSRAIYWDGKNQSGEKVATGVYFYTLKAGDFTATRKMLIRK